MFSSFFSSSSGSEPRPRVNYSTAELWGPENHTNYWRMVNLSNEVSGEERILERAELFYRTGALGLKYTNQIPYREGIEARKFVLRDSGLLSMYGWATTRYGTYIHGSENYGGGLMYSNRQKYPLTPAIFLRFFDISVQLASLSLFAEDFNRCSVAMGGISSVNSVLRQTYPQTDVINLMFTVINKAIASNSDKIVILALYNLLLNNLHDEFYAPNPKITVVNTYREAMLNAVAVASDINNKDDMEYYNSWEFRNKFTNSIPTYQDFYNEFINQFDIKYDQMRQMNKRLIALEINQTTLQIERQHQAGLQFDGRVGYAGKQEQLPPTLRKRRPNPSGF